MGKPSAPPPTDYAAAATAQGAANKETAMTSWLLQNSNQNTPYGSRKLTKTGPGDTDYQLDVTLDPVSQQNLDKQRAAQSGLLDLAPAGLETAKNILGTGVNTGNLPSMVSNVDTKGSQQLDFSNLPGQVYGVGDTGDIRQKMEDAAWGKYISRAQPQFQQQEEALNTRLANMGGVTTSPGAERQMGNLRTGQGDQMRQAIFDSILQGGNAAQQEQGMRLNSANLWNQSRGQEANMQQQQTQFNNAANQQDIQNAFANANLANAGRGQGLQEMTALRQMPLNELMAMLGGSQVQQPNFQNLGNPNIQPAPIFQAAQATGAQNQQQYQQETSSNNNMMSGVSSLAGMAMMAF